MTEPTGNDFTFLSKLVQSQDYSDMKLQHGDKTFSLHKSIVCPQSPVIEAAFKGGFQESATNALKIDDSFAANTLQCMIDYFYKGTYVVEPTTQRAATSTKKKKTAGAGARKCNTSALSDEDKASALSLHLSVIEIADYYHVPGLQKLATTKMESLLVQPWVAETFIDIAIRGLAKFNDGPFLEMVAKNIAKHLTDLVELDQFDQLVSNPAIVLQAMKTAADEMTRDKNTVKCMNECLDQLSMGWMFCLHCDKKTRGYISRFECRCTTEYLVQCEECGECHE